MADELDVAQMVPAFVLCSTCQDRTERVESHTGSCYSELDEK